MRPGDSILLDQYAHASVVDGAILSKASTAIFRHNSPNDLDLKLKKAANKKLVVVEGVYSMDGDVCPLPEIVEVCKKHSARILIDEAHSTFVFGKNGRGIVEHFNLEDEIDFHLGTFSKSLGGQGGFVCASREVIAYSNAFSRSRMFSCNLSPIIAAGLLEGLRIAIDEPQLREQLWKNVEYLRSGLNAAGVDTGTSTSPIIPVMINNDSKIFPISEKIQDRGLFLQPVTYPAVTKQKSRLRISVSAAHTMQELDQAVSIISCVLNEEGILRK